MEPTWVLLAPDGPHVGPINLNISCYLDPTPIVNSIWPLGWPQNEWPQSGAIPENIMLGGLLLRSPVRGKDNTHNNLAHKWWSQGRFLLFLLSNHDWHLIYHQSQMYLSWRNVHCRTRQSISHQTVIIHIAFHSMVKCIIINQYKRKAYGDYPSGEKTIGHGVNSFTRSYILKQLQCLLSFTLLWSAQLSIKRKLKRLEEHSSLYRQWWHL